MRRLGRKLTMMLKKQKTTTMMMTIFAAGITRQPNKMTHPNATISNRTRKKEYKVAGLPRRDGEERSVVLGDLEVTVVVFAVDFAIMTRAMTAVGDGFFWGGQRATLTSVTAQGKVLSARAGTDARAYEMMLGMYDVASDHPRCVPLRAGLEGG